MHEMGFAEGILAVALDAADGRKVRRIQLQVGKLHQVVGDSLQFSFELLATETSALAVNGTVNDLAMCGARPLYLSVAFILEEGCPMEDIWKIVLSMNEVAKKAGVSLVTGDTKVVDRGKSDKIFINTSGMGLIEPGVDISPKSARPGDKIIINGAIAAHGMAIMSVREGLEFETEIVSDTAPLNGLVDAILTGTKNVHVLRDPTRGGVASVLNEVAGQAAEDAERALQIMREHPLGKESGIIGEVVNQHPGIVFMKTRIGGMRVVDMLSGEQLPGIC